MDNLARVTVDDVMSWEPCEHYPRERVEELFAGRESVTALDVLDSELPADDILWAVLREEMVPAPVLHEFACRVAEMALEEERKAGREPDARSWAAVEAKRKWLRGEISDEELDAARAAAWAAVCAAAHAAASAAASAAACAAADAAACAAADAAQNAAYNATWAAAWAAARTAAYDAARAAARREQCELLREMLMEGPGSGRTAA